MPNAPLIAYLGDDFTGSTDALECLTLAGARTVLFVEPPTPEMLAGFGQLDAVGVASTCRSMSPAEMDAFLPPALAAIKRLGASHVHYKVCSTFDSSPRIGSIGRVIDIARRMFSAPFVPLVVGAPQLGRYCLFGNLFVQLGSDGPVHRLDRHPSMSCHPVTPADEGDLRLHLARQTDKRIGLVDIRNLSELRAAAAVLKMVLADGAEIVLFDVLEESQLAIIGQLLEVYATFDQPMFSVGSSGVDVALGNAWAAAGTLRPNLHWPVPPPVEPLLVVAGSCSPVTSDQIAFAVADGFAEVSLDAAALVAGKLAQRDIVTAVVRSLREGRSTIIHTSGTRAARPVPAEALGARLGSVVRDAIGETGVQRLLIAGGDTSGYLARELGVTALEMVARIVPGAPLCRAHSADPAIQGLEMNFKGGQIGGRDYFRVVAGGA